MKLIYISHLNLHEFLLCYYVSGPVPDGADAVVQIEDTEQVTSSSDGLKWVRILIGVSKGCDIRPVV